MDRSTVTQVLIDHKEPLIRAGLAASLSMQPRVVVSTRPEAEPQTRHDVVIADYTRGLSILEQLRTTGRALPIVRVLVIATAAKAEEIRHALHAGVHGYLLTSSTENELRSAVDALARGQRAICPTAAQHLVDSLGQCALTSREIDVLRVLVAGRPNKSIAAQLDISLGTVKTHVKSILQKLGATSRTHAAAIATQRGVLSAASPRADLEDELASAGSVAARQRPVGPHPRSIRPRVSRPGAHASV